MTTQHSETGEPIATTPAQKMENVSREHSEVAEMAGRIANRMDGRTVTSHEHYRHMLKDELTHELSAVHHQLQKAREEEREEWQRLADSAEMLWVCLANVSEGDWTKQTPEWQEAAKRWRDNYFGVVVKKDHSELDQDVPEVPGFEGTLEALDNLKVT